MDREQPEVQNKLPISTGKTKKKKSVAQPRPRILVEPRGIGPIAVPNENDVLSGRGGRINAHPGNVQFRRHVIEKREIYLDSKTKKLEKAHIAALLVYNIRSLDPAGRFLKQDDDGSWWDIGDQKAIKKVGQAMREFSRMIPKDERSESAKSPVNAGASDQSMATTNSFANAESPASSHGLMTSESMSYKQVHNHLDHPSTVIDALQELRNSSGPAAAQAFSANPTNNHDTFLPQYEHTQPRIAMDIANNSAMNFQQFAQRQPYDDLRRHSGLARMNETRAASIPCAASAGRFIAPTPVPVSDEVWGRDVFPTKAGLSALGPSVQQPEGESTSVGAVAGTTSTVGGNTAENQGNGEEKDDTNYPREGSSDGSSCHDESPPASKRRLVEH